jgi:NAD/NADP transhydrogenase alpha subunit
MYGRNVTSLFTYLFGANAKHSDPSDEIAVDSCVTRAGAVVSERVRTALEGNH